MSEATRSTSTAGPGWARRAGPIATCCPISGALRRARGGDEWRGADGPLHTSYGWLANPLFRAFVDAGRQAGYAESEDLNGFRLEGFGRLDMTVHRGRRW